MIINEDFFKDIEIEDSDIQSTDNINEQQLKTVEEYMEYFDTNFTDTIVFQFSNWNNGHALEISNVPYKAEYMEKRLFQVFDVFNISHSEIMLATDYRRTIIPAYITDVGKYKLILNTYNTQFNFIYAVVYIKYETMSPRTVLHFIESLMNIIWKSNRDIVDITFVKKVLRYEEYEERKHTPQINLYRSQYRAEHDPNYIGGIIDRHYFMSAMTYFFGREKADHLRYNYKKK